MRRLFIRTATQSFFLLTYLATFFLSFHYFFITYINSTFLSRYVSEKDIGILYTVGSLLTVIIFLNIARILKRWGNYKAMLFFLAMRGLGVLGLALFNSIPMVVISFILANSIYPLLIVSLDIFLEHYSTNDTTGRIRGVFFTIMNGTAIVCPLAVGFLVGFTSYRTVYLISFAFMVALFILVYSKFKNYRDTEYHTARGITVIIKFLKDTAVRQVFMTSLMLQIFYSWMIVYVPLYLYEYLHFSWLEIGIIISISLIPFVIFEIPLGELADERIGEKEILMVGFLIMIGALVIMGQSVRASLPLWIALLALSRTGASFVEVASDTYFFKKINPTNDELVSFWRITNPLGYIVGAIAGSVSLIIIPFQYIFFVLAGILIIGLIYSAKIEDTL